MQQIRFSWLNAPTLWGFATSLTHLPKADSKYPAPWSGIISLECSIQMGILPQHYCELCWLLVVVSDAHAKVRVSTSSQMQ
jgi:hypothetical protein